MLWWSNNTVATWSIRFCHGLEYRYLYLQFPPTVVIFLTQLAGSHCYSITPLEPIVKGSSPTKPWIPIVLTVETTQWPQLRTSLISDLTCGWLRMSWWSRQWQGNRGQWAYERTNWALSDCGSVPLVESDFWYWPTKSYNYHKRSILINRFVSGSIGKNKHTKPAWNYWSCHTCGHWPFLTSTISEDYHDQLCDSTPSIRL